MKYLLHEAVRTGNETAVRALLNTSNVNAEDENGNTPILLVSCIKDENIHNSILKILIENGAKINFFNKGMSALYTAVFHQREAAVEMLLKCGADISTKNLLHIAAQNGSTRILHLLLDDKRCSEDIINARDDRGRTPVYITAQHQYKDCLKMLICKGANLAATCPNNNNEDETVMDIVFQQMVNPVEFMLDVLDSCVHLEKTSLDKNAYFVDFSVLAPKDCHRQMDVISSVVAAASDEEKTEVLQHPLIGLYLTLKWSKLCYFFYLWIGVYIAFVFALSIYVITLTKSHQLNNVRNFARCFMLVTATGLLAHATLQLLLTSRKLYQKYETWLNIFCTSLSIIVAVGENSAGNWTSASTTADIPDWILHTTSIVVLLAWTQLMLLLGRLPTFGYYALMFSAVLQNVIKVMAVFLCLVIGFALSFSIQFRNHEPFGDSWRALVKTTVMMMGEFDYGGLFADKGNDPTSRVIFLMFIILTSIVLMNLMVGLAVSDIQSLQRQSHAVKLEKQAEFLAQLEKVIWSKQFTGKFIPRFIRRILEQTGIERIYELKTTSAHFPRATKLSSCRLIESLVAIAKARRVQIED